MKINNDHMYHGAALTQIAEHAQFTSINAVRISGELSRSAFRVNDTIGVYLKYATEPKAGADYVFTFTESNKAELAKLSRMCEEIYIALICVVDRQVCCISYDEFVNWIQRREDVLRRTEVTSTILVRLPKGKAFRLNMNMPRRRGVYLDDDQLVARNRYPNVLFD